MSANIQSDVSFLDGYTVTDHFKAFINYLNAQSKVHDDKVFARYYSDGRYKTLTYAQIDHLSTNLACKWVKNAVNANVISLICDHSVTYLIIMIAIMKLRVTMMAVSTRNSEAAITNLLEKTNSKLFIADEKYSAIASAAASNVPNVKIITITFLDIDTLLKEPLNPDYKQLLDMSFSDDDKEKSALIIHSSGSTSFPKPIYLSNRYLLNMLRCYHLIVNAKEGLEKITDKDVMLTCAPLFHIFGVFACFSMVTFGASTIFLPKLPASQSEIHESFVSNKCTLLCAPPLILEEMIFYLKEHNDFTHVRRLKYILFGGAPFKRESGDWLHAQGINIHTMYGTTEIGPIMTSDMNNNSKSWNSVSMFDCYDSEGKPYAVYEINDPSEPDVYHLYLRADSPYMATGVGNREDGGYDTNDLFKQDPNCPGRYQYLGRRDDTIIMENGEKTNPLPMEGTIRESPMVKQVVVLGQSRQCTAALIEVDMDYAIHFGPEDIIAAVHDAVKEANKECPNHSIILPQMVKILPFDQHLPSTDKGTVIRKRVTADFKEMIDKLYYDFLEGPKRGKLSNDDSSTWVPEQVENFLIDSAADVLGIAKSSFKDHHQSIFDLGLNSLLSIQLRNKIAQYFDNVPQNFLFEHPSIHSMRSALLSDQREDINEQLEKRTHETQELAKNYIKKAKADFPFAKNDYSDKRDKVILLTGATGSLGSFMLRDLLENKEVKKVYCCVRGQAEKLFERLIESFESRDLNVTLLKTDRVEVLPMNFNEPFLGFSEEKYNQLKEEVTIVQHCAWLLDFNMNIEHYDKECIAPFYNLLKFAYKEVNPMHVHFISSVSASAAAGEEIAEEPLPLDAHVTMPMGYAHSKFVVEILFNYLTVEKNFPCYVERLGQVCGDSINGVWNISEQYPLMFIGGGSVMHKMPELDTVIDWITVDYASASIVEIMLRTAYLSADNKNCVYHVVNPNLIHWVDVLEAMKGAGMKFETISTSQWVEDLAKDTTNPASKLLSFYESNFNDSFKFPIWQTKKTSLIAPIIKECPVLDTNLFAKYLKRWQTVGFYDPSL
ncbi:uncharacterized protein BX663DRAFT_428813 [Cokeromyces recurvatus]|uniref:uncharacterized protein n=1 Tax=Cokeromyces recurvatus TaxID=90255 RepID=UPI00222030AF|nr:uncharacterized protein BX663DRAFT_428813 [Cokeromyces recurvatus]KAI7906054.1 hypothetical protein BX663DRAFT_428813 [Cokeromyces recurvatus]